MKYAAHPPAVWPEMPQRNLSQQPHPPCLETPPNGNPPLPGQSRTMQLFCIGNAQAQVLRMHTRCVLLYVWGIFPLINISFAGLGRIMCELLALLWPECWGLPPGCLWIQLKTVIFMATDLVLERTATQALHPPTHGENMQTWHMPFPLVTNGTYNFFFLLWGNSA